MSWTLQDFQRWGGVWGGAGEAQTGMPISLRVEFDVIQDGNALRMHFEACDPGYQSLYHGVRAVLATAPSGALRAVAFSTIHKAFLLDLLPDEEGVMALHGVTSAGNRIWVTFKQESSDALQFTGFWRAPGQPVDAPGLPRMSAQLRRLRPLQFANPPG
jgi:hypothetical protein